MKKQGYALASLIFVSALTMIGAEEASAQDSNVYNYEDFEQTVSNTSEPTGEGTLQIGYTSSTPFEGTLNWAFYTLGPDADILSFFDESVFTFDENNQATNDGAIEYEVNEEDSTVKSEAKRS